MPAPLASTRRGLSSPHWGCRCGPRGPWRRSSSGRGRAAPPICRPPAPIARRVIAGGDRRLTQFAGSPVCQEGPRSAAFSGTSRRFAEYVIMTMLVLTHRLFETVTSFRAGSWVASPTFGGGPPHGEVLGRTIGIIGYGRIGREVAERAAGIKCRVLAANRSPVADPAPANTVFP